MVLNHLGLWLIILLLTWRGAALWRRFIIKLIIKFMTILGSLFCLYYEVRLKLLNRRTILRVFIKTLIDWTDTALKRYQTLFRKLFIYILLILQWILNLNRNMFDLNLSLKTLFNNIFLFLLYYLYLWTSILSLNLQTFLLHIIRFIQSEHSLMHIIRYWTLSWKVWIYFRLLTYFWHLYILTFLKLYLILLHLFYF